MGTEFTNRMFVPEIAEEMEKIGEEIIEPGMPQAFAELYLVLHHTTDEVKRCIPDKFMSFLQENMDHEWHGKLDFSKNLNDMDMLPATRGLISLVYRDFLCSDDERKELIKRDQIEAANRGEMYEEESLRDLIALLE